MASRQLAEVNLTLSDANVRQGVELLEELHSEYPGVPRHKYRLACACQRLGELLRHDVSLRGEAERFQRRAVQLLTELVRDFPDTPDYHSRLAAALDGLLGLTQTASDREEALKLLEQAIARQRIAVEANPQNRTYREYLARHLGSLATMLEELGRTDDVGEVLTQRLELLGELASEDADSFSAQRLHCQREFADWLTRQGEYDEAASRYEELLAAFAAPGEGNIPAAEQNSLRGSVHHGLGNIFLASQELESARQSFQAAIDQQELAQAADPDCVPYRAWRCRHLCRLGTVIYRQGHSKQAEATWTRAIDIYREVSPGMDSAGQQEVAWMLIDGGQSWDAGTVVTLAEEALQHAPSSWAIWMTLGVAQYRSGQWPAAVDALRKADELSDGNSCIYFYLAMANWQIGEKAEAAVWYEQAMNRLDSHAPKRNHFVEFRQQADACIGSAVAIRGTEQPEGTTTSLVHTHAVRQHIWQRDSGLGHIRRYGQGRSRLRAGRRPVAFRANETQQQFPVAVYADTETEAAEDFVVSIVDVAGATVAQRRAGHDPERRLARTD